MSIILKMNLNNLNIKSLNKKLLANPSNLRVRQDGGEEEDMYTEPQEDIIEENKFQYKRIWDPKTDQTTYYTRPAGGKKWKDLQDGKNDRALTSVKANVFKDVPMGDWENHPDKKDWDGQMTSLYKQKKAKESMTDIQKSVDGLKDGEYAVEIIQYPYGYNPPEGSSKSGGAMPPGHMEARVLSTKLPSSVQKKIDSKEYQGHINWWFDGNRELDYDPSKHYQKGVRTVVMKLTEDELNNFVDYSKNITDSKGGMTEAVASNADGINGLLKAFNVDFQISPDNVIPLGAEGYNFLNSNCAEGVCSALGVDDPSTKNMGTRDPKKAMDFFLGNKKWKDKIIHKSGIGVEADESTLVTGKDKDMWKKIIKLQKWADDNGFNMADFGSGKAKLPPSLLKKTTEIFSDDISGATKGWLDGDEAGQILSKIELDMPTLQNIVGAAGTGNVMEIINAIPNKQDMIGQIPGIAWDKGRNNLSDWTKEADNEEVTWSNFATQIPKETANYLRKDWNATTKALGDLVDPIPIVTDININQDFNKAVESIPKYWSKGGKGYKTVTNSYLNPVNWGIGIPALFEDGGGLPVAKTGQGFMRERYGNYNPYQGQFAKTYSNPIQTAYMPMSLYSNTNPTSLISNVVEGVGRFFSGKDKDGDGLMDGILRDNKAKKNRRKAARDMQKAMNYDYKVTVDPNDPNYDKSTGKTNYVASALDLYNASSKKNPTTLTTADRWMSHNMGDAEADNTTMTFNEKTNTYDLNYMDPKFMSKNKKLHNVNNDPTVTDMRNRFSNLSEDQKTRYKSLVGDLDDFQSEVNAGNMPEGKQFAIDERGATGIYDAGAVIPENSKETIYNTLMMKRKGGQMQEGGQPSPEEMAMMEQQAQQQQPQEPAQEAGSDDVSQLMTEIRAALEKGAKPQEVMGQLLQAGMQPDAVAQIFVQLGMPQDQVMPAIEQVMSQMQGGQEGAQAQPSEEEMMAMAQGAPQQPMMQMGAEVMEVSETTPTGRYNDLIMQDTLYQAQPGTETGYSNLQEVGSQAGNAMKSLRPLVTAIPVEDIAADRENQRLQRMGTINQVDGGNPDPRLESLLQRMNNAKLKLDTEISEVDDIRNTIAKNARALGDAGAKHGEVGISDRTAAWVDEHGFGCNTYSCQIMRDSGVTIPQGTKDFTMNGRTYTAGDKLPIIPGNAQFNSYAENLGFELQPKGTLPDDEGDLVRGHMYNQGPGGAFSGSQHSLLSAGYGDDEIIDLYNNSGAVYSGYKPSKFRSDDVDYYTDDSGVMKYVRDIPAFTSAYDKAKAEYDAYINQNGLQQDRYGGGFRAQTGTEVFEQEADMAQAQALEDATMEMDTDSLLAEIEAMIAQGVQPAFIYQKLEQMGIPANEAGSMVQAALTKVKDSMQMGPTDGASIQETEQEDEYAKMLQQLEEQKSMLQNQYRKKIDTLKLKKTGGQKNDAIELTTAQIAKIMQAGGSVKYL